MDSQAIPQVPIQRSQSELAKAFAKAQGQFRTPQLNRTAKVLKEGRLLYETHYADLQECIDCVKKPLSDNGLSFTQTTQLVGTQWMLVLDLIHESGESRQSFLPLNVQQTNQQLGGTMTYLKRYQLSAFFGLAADFDDDGNATESNDVEFKSTAQKNNPPMQKALNQKPKNHAPGASKPPEDDLDQAFGPPMTLLEKIYALVEERAYTEEQTKAMVVRVLGSAKKSNTWTAEEQDKIYKYLTMLTKG